EPNISQIPVLQLDRQRARAQHAAGGIGLLGAAELDRSRNLAAHTAPSPLYAAPDPRSLRGADRRRGNLVVAESRGSSLLRCARNDNGVASFLSGRRRRD